MIARKRRPARRPRATFVEMPTPSPSLPPLYDRIGERAPDPASGQSPPWVLPGVFIVRKARRPSQCAGLNRHEAEEEEASRARTSDPLGPEFCAGHREVHGEA